MNRRSKIIFGLLGIGLLTILIFIGVGLYSMEIEDHYGDNQDFFYKSKFGDIAVNRDKKEFGKIEKSWTRVFIVDNDARVDIWRWLKDNRIEVYRARPFVYDKEPTFDDIERLIKDDKLELIIKNW